MDAIFRVRSSQNIVLGSLLVFSFWSVASIAANSTDIGCDGSDRSLQSLRVSMDSLSVQSVDSTRAIQTPVAAEKSAVASKAIAPILHLAPHITAMLNSIFDSNESVASPETEVNSTESPTAGRASQSSDVVTDQGIVSPPAKSLDRNNNDIARFQRQMYRKDI